jgi:FkbM family methyltransferase
VNLAARVARKGNRVVKHWIRLPRARRFGITFHPPNYIYVANLDESSVLIDVGCAADADFSLHMIERFGLRAYGVDPTRKHAPALRALEARTNGRFRHLLYAVTARSGTLTFHESEENVSGSLFEDHTNMRRDSVRSYDVRGLTLRELIEHVGVPRVAFLKLDVEGAEYELLESVRAQDLAPFEQVFVEFHHHALQRYSIADTQAVVRRLESLGRRAVSLDDHNYLFCRSL